MEDHDGTTTTVKLKIPKKKTKSRKPQPPGEAIAAHSAQTFIQLGDIHQKSSDVAAHPHLLAELVALCVPTQI